MNTVKLEYGIIGDALMGSFSAHPSPLKGEEGHGLRPEHFSDPSARAAFEIIQKADVHDAAALQGLVVAKLGAQFCEKAIAEASVVPSYALARLGRLAERGRIRLAGEALTRLVQSQGEMTEAFFFAEADRIVRGTSAAVQAASLKSETVEEFVATPPAPLDPIVANCFERGDKVELVAPSKCRKSFWALDLALHVAAGLPFCGLAIPKPRRVLLVNLEIKRDWMKRRVLQRLGGYGLSAPDLQGRLSLMNCRGQGGHVRDAILTRVKTLKPDFVIVDPRYKLMRPDEDENTGNGLIGILNLLDAVAEEGAAVMIVSHDKKGDIKSQDIRDRGAGSNWEARDVDCRFVMTPKKNDEYGVEVGILARNYPPRPSLDLKAEVGRFVSGVNGVSSMASMGVNGVLSNRILVDYPRSPDKCPERTARP